ncbi:MAG: secretin N-terminal domain-containing protein, partial [Limisphaerales bacterium]
MKTHLITLIAGLAVLWLNGTASAQAPGRPAVTNSVRVIIPRLLNTNQGVRTVPGPPPTARKASPFLSSGSTMAPLPGAAAPKASSTNVPGQITPPSSTPAFTPTRTMRTTPRAATARPIGSVTTNTVSAVPAPKRPAAIAAPAARRPDASGNILGSTRAQNAREVLAEMNELDASGSTRPKVHPLVPAHKVNDPASLNFPNTPIDFILEEYALYTERTMLKGNGINDQITMDIVAVDDTKLTVNDALQAFDIVLNQNQVAVVPVGDKFLLAIPSAQATKEGLPFLDIDPAELPESPTLVTKIVQLEYAEPKDIIQVIQKFAKVAGGITSVDSTKMLIIQDYAINLKRMLELIAKVDVAAPANEQIFKVISIRYAPVREVADMLGTFTAKGSASGSARTTGTSARSSGGGVRNPASNNNRSSANRNSSAAASRGFRPLQQSRVPAPTRVAQPASSASNFNARLRSIVNAANNDEPEPLLGNASISYYERSNSILVRGTREEVAKVEELIEELDQVQPQVLIEAIIMDVSLTDDQQFGINILQNRTAIGNNNAVAGGVNNGAGNFFSSFSGTNSLSTAISTLAGGFSYYGLFGRNWETVIRAVETENFATVLS